MGKHWDTDSPWYSCPDKSFPSQLFKNSEKTRTFYAVLWKRLIWTTITVTPSQAHIVGGQGAHYIVQAWPLSRLTLKSTKRLDPSSRNGGLRPLS